MKMNDINGVEMKTGDIVRIANAYFKNDNGVYFIAHTPEDASWCGSDYSLRKMCNNGKISTAKYSLAFWPLSAFTSNRLKNAECHEWNKEHATIEVIYNIDNTQVIEHFKEEADRMKQQTERNSMYYGDDCQTTITSKAIYNLYLEVVARMEAKEEIEEPEAEPETIEELVEEVQEIVQEVVQESQPEVIEIERKYFPIDEKLAYYAKQQWSFSDYKKGSITQDCTQEVNSIYDIVDRIAKEKPDYLTEAVKLAERYSQKLSNWWNVKHNIDMMCPSVMICGPANYPVRKHERQMSRLDSHFKELDNIKAIKTKLENILNGKAVIKSNNGNAIELLEKKIEQLEADHKHKMYCNAYYKKNGTLKGCEGLTDTQIAKIEDFVSRNPFFPPFIVCNDTANIRRYKERLESLQKAKTTPTQESETIQSSVCQVVENTDLMRIQLIFDEKPDEETRSILKSNGFKWAPSQKAWQRQLTSNAKYSTKKVIEQLEKLTA